MLHHTMASPDLLHTNRQQDAHLLTLSQQRMWVIHQLNRQSTAYNSPVVRKISGPLDAERLRAAFVQLLLRHEQLRVGFRLDGTVPVLDIHAYYTISFSYRAVVAEDLQAVLSGFIQPFSLDQASLIRAGLFSISGTGDHVLILDMHHIISDLRSEELLVRDLFKLYEDSSLPALPMTYTSYASQAKQQVSSAQLSAAVTFWASKLSGELPVMVLPTDRKRPAVFDFRGSIAQYPIAEQVVKRLHLLAAQYDTSLYEVCLSTLFLLLSKYCYQEDFVIGLPHEVRPVSALEDVVGLFINTLPVRAYPTGKKTFRQLLTEVSAFVQEARQYHYYDVGQLVETYCPQRDPGRNPLYDVLFFYQEQHVAWYGEREVSPMAFVHHKAEVDLTFGIVDCDGLFHFSIEYYSGLFDAGMIDVLAGYYHHLLETVSVHPDLLLEDISLLTAAEQQQLLSSEPTDVDGYPLQSIGQLFEAQVALSPMGTALVFQGAAMSYGMLNERVNQLARQLHSAGIGAGDVVGVLAGAGNDMIVAVLAILKVGGIYLAIDAAYPTVRIRYMLDDSVCVLLLSQTVYLPLALSFGLPVVAVSDEGIGASSGEVIVAINDASLPAYITYTSGSSGHPKGIVIRHSNVVCTVMNTNYITIGSTDRILQLSNYVFDAFVFEAFGALLHGATLVIGDADERQDVRLIEKLIAGAGVTVAFMTTALFNTMVDVCPRALLPLRKLLTGGEEVSVRHMRTALSYLGRGKLLHMYGPSESTVYASYYPVDDITVDAVTVPIGYAVSHKQLYVLSGQALTPVGVPGELCITGEGLAAGYLQSQLMEGRFMKMPLLDGVQMYRTGDIVKRDAEGALVFVGRKDMQTKIRGYRIELGEVMYQLRNFAGIGDAAVAVLRSSAGDKYLHAFYTVKAGEEVILSAFQEYLRGQLPAYMLPGGYTELDALPYTHNGKVDIPRLSAMAVKPLSDRYAPPVTERERQVAEIWRDILQQEQTDIHQHFFASGGHSLTATILSLRLQQDLGVSIPLSELFQHLTIAGVAARIDADQSRLIRERIPISRSRKRKYYPLSFSETMVYVHQHGTRNNHSYQSIFPMMITGVVDKDRLEQALQALVQRHEIFRSGYLLHDGRPAKVILERVGMQLYYREGSKKEVPALIARLRESYALDAPPLFRAVLLKLGVDKYFFALGNHHIISDGVTEALFMREISQLYAGKRLKAVRWQYRDFVLWEQQQWAAGYYRQQEAFWLAHLHGSLPVLSLPADHPRPAQVTFEGHTVYVTADTVLTAQIKQLASAQDTTLFIVLFSAYTILLHKYTEQDDIIVGVPMANRLHAELQEIMGMFVNMVPWRSYPHADKYFLAYLTEVKAHAAAAYTHQEYPFERLVKLLRPVRDTSRNPLFDTIFILQNTELPLPDINGLSIVPFAVTDNATKVDITIEALEHAGTIQFSFKYRTALFEEGTINRMAGHFMQLLTDIVQYPGRQLRELQLLTEGERHQLLNQFNGVETVYPHDRSLYQLFAEQVARAPDHTAVRFGSITLTYAALHAQAAYYAAQLIVLGAGVDVRVAIIADRSVEMIIAIWAILRAGGTYVPIDPDYPPERIAFMLADSGVSICVTTYEIYPYLGSSFAGKLLIVDRDAAIQAVELPAPEAAHAPAYIMYTSGSTGAPKGIAVSHHNVIRTVVATNYISIGAADRLLQVSNYAFDGSVFDIFGALLNGATLILMREEQLVDMEALEAVIVEQGVSIMFITTALFNICVQTYPDCFLPLRKLLFGGEQVSIAHVKMALACLGSDKLIHVYGPTENTVFSTAFAVGEDASADTIPIGAPISNTSAYVLNADGMLNPIGIPGELYVGGAGVSMGYWNKPALTAERFVRHPLAEGGVLYRTGDIVKWREDGNLVFVRRGDQQVKLRGFRIEPGEIEAQLALHPDVDQSAVVINTNPVTGEKRLYGYYTAVGEVADTTLRDHLSKALPYYMVPERLIHLAALPLTSNGKVNRSALSGGAYDPDVERHRPGGGIFLSPESPTEIAIAAVWCEVFGLEQVSIRDNFYALGGHSLKALEVVNLLQQRGYSATVSDLFSYPTIVELAINIGSPGRRLPMKKKPSSGQLVSGQAATARIFPLSAVQQRFFQRGVVNRNIFNSPFLVALTQHVPVEVIQRAMEGILVDHPILTVYFREGVEGKWEQCYGTPKPADYFLQVDLGEAPISQQQALITAHCTSLQGQFHLTEGPLFRMILFDNYLEAGKQVLFFLCHHLLFDGISWQVLTDELRDRCLQPAATLRRDESISYQEWCLRLVQYARTGKFKAAAQYWKQVSRPGQSFLPDLSPGTPPLQRDMVYYVSDVIRDAALIQELQQAVSNYKGNVFHLLLAAFFCACRDVRACKRLSLYVMTAQRESFFSGVSIARTMGFFAGAYPISIALKDPMADYNAVVSTVKTALLRVPKGGLDYFVLKHLLPEGGGIPDVETPILFHYLNLFTAPEEGALFRPMQLPVGLTHDLNNPSAYLINITATMDQEGLQLTFYYSQAHFHERTIAMLSAAFKRHLIQMIRIEQL